MPEAVIVDAIRTPIGRAAKGSLKDVRARRPRRRAAQRARRAQPGGRLRRDRRPDDGLRLPDGRAGYNVGRNAALLAGHRPSRPGDDRQPLLRLLAADDPDGLPRDQGRRGRPVHRRRRRGRLALPRAPAVRPAPAARRLRGRALQRLHPDGAHGRERRRALQRLARGAGRVGRDSRSSAPSPRASPGTSTPRSSPVTLADGTEVTRDDGPRPGTTVEVLAELKPAFGPTARSRPATPARSTTAPRRCS